MTKLELKTIPEVVDTEENMIQGGSETKIEHVGPKELDQDEIIETKLIIPILGDETANKLWQEVRDLKEKDRVLETSTPLSIVGLTEYMGIDNMSLRDNQSKGEDDGNSEANTLATLPSFLGEYKAKMKVLQVP